MNVIKEYAKRIHEQVEIPRNELRRLVYLENKEEYHSLLDQFEEEYYKKCVKLGNLLEEEYKVREEK